MKILLVRPKPHKETIGLKHVMICEPLELEYLISNIPDDIKSEIKAEIVDMILERESFEDILARIKPDFIVFTGYITHVGTIKEMAKTAKTIVPSVKTGVGGVHAEVVPRDFISDYIDFIYDKNGIDNFNISLRGLLNNKSPEEIKAEINKGLKKSTFDYRYPARMSSKLSLSRIISTISAFISLFISSGILDIKYSSSRGSQIITCLSPMVSL
jgi:hypothetical protein